MSLSKLLVGEQRAFLHRSRSGWEEHIAKARTFLGEGLRTADPGRPVLILGAGSGLEIPWKLASKKVVGWDADPWSRWRTCLRHQRFPEWVFEDLTGGMAELEATARRALMLPDSIRRRPPERAVRRLAGLLPSLHPSPRYLQKWLAVRAPGTILLANVLGQLGSVAQKVVESVFAGIAIWEEDVEFSDLLSDAMDAWIVRVLEALLLCLGDSGAPVWMLHDRAVIWGDPSLRLGSLQDPWLAQLETTGPLEVSDPLCGIDVRSIFSGRRELHFERWLWPVASGQLHLMEALAYSS